MDVPKPSVMPSFIHWLPQTSFYPGQIAVCGELERPAHRIVVQIRRAVCNGVGRAKLLVLAWETTDHATWISPLYTCAEPKLRRN